MTTKTKLIYWICAATIGFGNASTKAADDSPDRCSKEKHDAFVNCYTTYDFTSPENSIRGFKQCLRQHEISELEARECHKEMVKNLKDDFREKVKEFKSNK